MRKKVVPMSMFDIYENVSEAMEQDKPKLIKLLEEHIDFEQIIPRSFIILFILASADITSTFSVSFLFSCCTCVF